MCVWVCHAMWQDMDYTPFMQQLTQLTSSGNVRETQRRRGRERLRPRTKRILTVPAFLTACILCTFNYYCIILHLFTLIARPQTICPPLPFCVSDSPLNDEELLSAAACCEKERERGENWDQTDSGGLSRVSHFHTRTTYTNVMTTNCCKQLAGVLFKSPS